MPKDALKSGIVSRSSGQRSSGDFAEALRRVSSVLLTTCVAFVWLVASAHAQSFTVTSTADGGAGSLRAAITAANAFSASNPGSANTITFATGGTITLASELPIITSNVTIDGNGNNPTISGAGAYRPFFIGDAGTTAATYSVTLANLTIADGRAKGGDGGGVGGGGGAGLGGGAFVSSNGALTLQNVALSGNSAAGGSGALNVATAGNGGGGLGGAGGPFIPSGGGGLAVASSSIGVNGGGATGGAGAIPGNGGAGGFGGGGGAGAGAGATTAIGGNGGFGGGGGGAASDGLAIGGNGGYGGGGGGTNSGGEGRAGAGGFGGGGGATANGSPATQGAGGFGAGNGVNGSASVEGGGGLGAGGAVFVQAGGSLNVVGSTSLSGGLVAGGASGGQAGLAFGSGVFFQGQPGATTTFGFGAGDQTISDVIADYIGSGGTNPAGGTNAADQGGRLALAKTGGGALTLSGANTYSGGTTVDGGVLAVQTSASLGSGALALSNGATLILDGNGLNLTNNITVAGDPTFTVNAGNTNTISGNIADGGTPGDVVKDGGGTLIFSGANTYTGPTTVSQGTLRAGSTSAFGLNSATTVAGGATLDLGGFDNAIGSLAGAGFVTNSGGADAVLTTGGDNTSTTFSGVISDGATNKAGLTKTGSGAFRLSGLNTYTGVTSIGAGTLIVDGSIAGSSMTTVNSGATLSGIGTVGPLTVASGGLFAPGSGAAGSSMSVAGNLLFGSGAIYQTMVSPTTASFATVAGSATLTGASVSAVYAPGSYLTRQYTILRATGGLVGTTFAGLSATNLPAGIHDSLSYDANNVYLNLVADLGAIDGGGLPRNQRSVANGLNLYFNAGGLLPPNFVNLFGLTGPALRSALASLSGEASAGAQQTAFQSTNRFLDAMLDPSAPGRDGGEVGGVGSLAPALGYAAKESPPYSKEIARAFASVLKTPGTKSALLYEPRWSVWATSFGGYNRVGGDPYRTGSHDLSANVFGMAAGLDYRLAPETVLGVAMAGGGTSWGLSEGLGGGRGDFLQTGVYGSTRFGAAYVSAAFAFGNHWISTQRTAAFGDALTGGFSAQNYAGRFESGYRIATAFGGVTPYLAAQAQSFVRPDYMESDATGGGFALSYKGRSSSDTRGELGARFDHVFGVYGDATLLLRGRAAYAHDWVSDPTLAAAFMLLPGSGFTVEAAKPVKNSALASAGAELRLADGAALFAKFDGEFSKRSQSYVGSAGLRYSW